MPGPPNRVSGVGVPLKVKVLPSAAASRSCGAPASPSTATCSVPFRNFAIAASAAISGGGQAIIVDGPGLTCICAVSSNWKPALMRLQPPVTLIRPSATSSPSGLSGAGNNAAIDWPAASVAVVSCHWYATRVVAVSGVGVAAAGRPQSQRRQAPSQRPVPVIPAACCESSRPRTVRRRREQDDRGDAVSWAYSARQVDHGSAPASRADSRVHSRHGLTNVLREFLDVFGSLARLRRPVIAGAVRQRATAMFSSRVS